jgi:hypothetical protein
MCSWCWDSLDYDDGYCSSCWLEVPEEDKQDMPPVGRSEVGTKEWKEFITDFLDSELSDYGIEYTLSFLENYDECGETYHFESEEKRANSFHIRTDNEGSLSVEMSEDNRYDIQDYDYTVKYFWQAILWRD